MAGISPQLQATVDQWLQWDKDEASAERVRALVTAAASSPEAADELGAMFSKRIAFGTAGLRGEMKPGIGYMNDITVAQASQGLFAYMDATFSDLTSRGVCVGYDGRHHSKEYAHRTAATFLAKNVPVYLFNTLVPTPFVAFCVKHLKLCGGVMVTASHNPKQYNGYKVYWDSGSQIVAPHDKGIAKAIEENTEIWSDPSIVAAGHDLLRDPTSIIDAYYKASVDQCSSNWWKTGESQQKIVFTPMHGVGQPFVERVFQEFGLDPFVSVPEQKDPDPEFSTVPFPNPEEGRGALKLAFAAAERSGARVVIANDPDSDRLAVAERIAGAPSWEEGQEVDVASWYVFNGNELGALFGEWAIQLFLKKNGDVSDEEKANAFVVNTTVSSKMLRSIAERNGLQYYETLTGFKWMGNLAKSLIEQGRKFVFSFEEAIGYMIGDVCLDKDGVRAAGAMGQMVNHLYAEGKTLQGRLQELYAEYGYFYTKNDYFFCYDKNVMSGIFNEIRGGATDQEPEKAKYATRIGDFDVASVRDLTTGFDSGEEDKVAKLPRSSFMVTFRFANGGVITVRGSGTEPKLKYYTELPGKYEEREQVKATLQAMVNAVVETYMRPEENDLGASASS
eukprot:TRINITY_DN9870_c0_g1_i1.p1 TRINITY_DN9870_c0_g1~~TRINITY_DN9870_c0_g1_i1.p1  ORF type:complete len:619 (-),score=204.08 TRINITY_DN9870_c0_g1_i1:92-1948(-)